LEFDDVHLPSGKAGEAFTGIEERVDIAGSHKIKVS
jgi:hypothetical protein